MNIESNLNMQMVKFVKIMQEAELQQVREIQACIWGQCDLAISHTTVWLECKEKVIEGPKNNLYSKVRRYAG